MPDIVHVEYKQTGQSKSTNQYGMREMQEKAFEARDAQYLLLKAPPASGKSRALMFLALDKLSNQGIKKIIVAVPERSIGSSFSKTDLKQFGLKYNIGPIKNFLDEEFVKMLFFRFSTSKNLPEKTKEDYKRLYEIEVKYDPSKDIGRG